MWIFYGIKWGKSEHGQIRKSCSDTWSSSFEQYKATGRPRGERTNLMEPRSAAVRDNYFSIAQRLGTSFHCTFPYFPHEIYKFSRSRTFPRPKKPFGRGNFSSRRTAHFLLLRLRSFRELRHSLRPSLTPNRRTNPIPNQSTPHSLALPTTPLLSIFVPLSPLFLPKSVS